MLKFNDHVKLKGLILSADSSMACKKKFLKLYDKTNKKTFFESCIEDEIAPHLVHKLETWKINFDHSWRLQYVKTEKRISVLMNELEYVAKEFNNSNIKVVGLKNVGITKGLYPINACSPMGDLDLLVSTEDFFPAHSCLVNKLGYDFKFRSNLEDEDLKEAFKNGGTEYRKIVDGYEVWLELQWRPVAGRWIQPNKEPDGNLLIKKSIPISDSSVRLLSPLDNLLQVGLHTAKHSYCRAPGFRLHSDVDRVVRFSNIPWDEFGKTVISLNLKTAVYYSLYIPYKILNTPVPKKLLDKLRPPLLNRLIIEYFLNNAGLTEQNNKKFSRIGYILFNMSLYDSIFDLITAIIPTPKTMIKKYETNFFALPYFYIKRIMDLLLRRAKL